MEMGKNGGLEIMGIGKKMEVIGVLNGHSKDLNINGCVQRLKWVKYLILSIIAVGTNWK